VCTENLFPQRIDEGPNKNRISIAFAAEKNSAMDGLFDRNGQLHNSLI
jgi:hypothetical protein